MKTRSRRQQGLFGDLGPSKKKKKKKKKILKKPSRKKTANRKKRSTGPKKKPVSKKTKRRTTSNARRSTPSPASRRGKNENDGSRDGATARKLASRQREISVSEFFTKNRHLLGFDNPRKALLTTIKEAVDNSLDACEEAEILPELFVEIRPTKRDDRFLVIVEDNGPGIVKSQIPQIFARLLYGSKFHSRKQQRGQQGIGISAAAMYGQITTGKPVRVVSRIGKRHPAQAATLKIDTVRNRPEVVRQSSVNWDRAHGTRIELELEARVQRGKQSVDEYLLQTAISNPHVQISYKNWDGETRVFERATRKAPPPAREIKPHPYGVEVGLLGNMLRHTEAKKLGAFLKKEFSRVSPKVAAQIAKQSGLTSDTWVRSIDDEQTEALQSAMQRVKLMAPATNCVTPIGEAGLVAGLKKELNADVYLANTRSPKIYRGNPFVVEVALAYGGELVADDSVRVLRLANRVPLLYQNGACACSKAVVTTDWRNYLLTQPRGSLPLGPMVVLLHVASVWVPFTSEAKEAVAHYPEILKEMRLALQEMGRKVATHIRKQRREADQLKKKSYIQAYLPAIGEALRDILELSETQANKTVSNLRHILEKSRKM